MSKIYYIYAVMNAGKSTELLQIDHNYQSNNMKTLLLKSSVDTRDSKTNIVSRLGLKKEALPLDDRNVQNIANCIRENNYDCILIDECQFLSKATILTLSEICDEKNVPIMFFGLKTDYTGHLFEGAKTLLEMADNFRELKTVCWCGKKATMNLRKNAQGRVIKTGESIHLGDSEFYSVCRKHWKSGETELGR